MMDVVSFGCGQNVDRTWTAKNETMGVDKMTDQPDDEKGYSGDPWNQQDWETGKAFIAFELYRDAGPGVRSQQYVADALGNRRAHIGNWAAENRWVERASAWDRHCAILRARQREREHQADLELFAEQQRKLNAAAIDSSFKMFRIAGAQLAKLIDEDGTLRDDVDPRTIPTFLRAAAYIGEVASNAQAQALAVRELLSRLELEIDFEQLDADADDDLDDDDDE